MTSSGTEWAMYSPLVGRLIRRTYREATAGETRLVRLLAAEDVEFVFPGDNSFAGTHRGKAAVLSWLERFAALHPQLTVHDVIVSGPLWNLRIAMHFTDAIGADYRNDGMELISVRRGRVRRIEVFLNTQTISAWESRHPELATIAG